MSLPAGIAAALLPAAAADEEIRRRAAEVLRDGGYQTELPQRAAPLDLHLPLGPLELLVRILLWGAAAVVAFLAIAWLVRRLAPAARDVEVAEPAGPAPVEIPIASAEALAAQGRWAEAIHALLLETLEALSRAARLAPSLTSREIVSRVPLPERARDALSGLVLAVEVSRFGGAAAAEDDYRACLGRFHAFLETYRGGAPARAGGRA
ncbi:MAG TPA: hypothetical protein VFL83_01875 [Anaeromyxobacter sp.]|nr:hypothetical protein [Anaeromyxobacter sp.]